MRNNTDIDYKEAIKAKFEKEKVGEFHAYLDNPSPANLRNLCLLKFDSGLNKIDKEIFKIYFSVNENEDLRSTIFNFTVSKFKAIQTFLNESEKDKSTSILNLNLLAVLVDFEPRPFNKFSKPRSINAELSEENDSKEKGEFVSSKYDLPDSENNDVVDKHANDNPQQPETNNKEEEEKPAPTPIFLVVDNSHAAETKPSISEGVKPKPKNWKKIAGIGFAGAALIALSYKIFVPNKECMKWCEDHYELVDCISDKKGFASYDIIKPYDEIEFQRKKLKVCDTTCFFKNNKSVVWYNKHKGEIHCYNMDGRDPVTDKELDQITDYMVNKYFAKNE